MSFENVVNVLGQLMLPDNVQRKAAEAQLEEWSSAPGFLLELSRFACQATSDPKSTSLRLVSLSVIKQKLHSLLLGLSAPEQNASLSLKVGSSFLSELGEVLNVLLGTMTTGPFSGAESLEAQIATTIGEILVLCERLVDQSPSEESTSSLNRAAQKLNATTQFLQNPQCGWVQQRIIVYSMREIFNSLPGNSYWREELLTIIPLLFGKANLSGAFIGETNAQSDIFSVLVQITAVNTLNDIYLWLSNDAEVEAVAKKEAKRCFMDNLSVFHSVLSFPFSRWIIPSQPNESNNDRTLRTLYLDLAVSYNNFIVDTIFVNKWAKSTLYPGDSSSVVEKILETLFADADCFSSFVNMEIVEEAGDDALGENEAEWLKDIRAGGSLDSEDANAACVTLLCSGAARRWGTLTQLLTSTWGRAALQRIAMQSEEKALRFLQLILQYVALPERVRVAWESDVNVYLQHEDERGDQIGWSVRDVTCDAFVKSCQAFGPIFLHASLEQLHERLFVTQQDDPTQSWKEREASLLLMGDVVFHCHKLIQQCGGADFSPLTKVILEKDACQSQYPLLAARGLHTLSYILRYMKKIKDTTALQNLCRPLLEMLCQQVFNPASSSATLVRASAYRLLRDILLLTDGNTTIEFFLRGGYHSLLRIFHQSSDNEGKVLEGEMLYLLLDIFVMWTSLVRQYWKKHGGDVPPSLLSSFGEANAQMPQPFTVFFQCWRSHMNDPNVADCIYASLNQIIKLDSLMFFPQPQELQSSFLSEMQWVQQVLLGKCSVTEYCAVPYFLRLLSCVFSDGSDTIAPPVASGMLNTLVQVVLSAEESAVVTSAVNALCALLNRCPPRSVAYPAIQLPNTVISASGSGELVVVELPRVLVLVVKQVLSPEKEESALLNIGNFLVSVAENASLFSTAEMGECVRYVTERLYQAKTAVVQMQLLAPLLVLLQVYPLPFLSIISETQSFAPFFASVFTNVRALRSAHVSLRVFAALLHTLEQWQTLTATLPVLDTITVPFTSVCGSTGPFTNDKQNSKNKKKSKKNHYESGEGAERAGVNANLENLPEMNLPTAIFVSVGKGLFRFLKLAEKGVLEIDQIPLESSFFPDEADSEDGDEEFEDVEAGVGTPSKTINRLFQENDSDSVEEVSSSDGDAEDGMKPTKKDRNHSNSAGCVGATPTARLFEELNPIKPQICRSLSSLPNLVSAFGPSTDAYFTLEEKNDLMLLFQFMN